MWLDFLLESLIMSTLWCPEPSTFGKAWSKDARSVSEKIFGIWMATCEVSPVSFAKTADGWWMTVLKEYVQYAPFFCWAWPIHCFWHPSTASRWELADEFTVLGSGSFSVPESNKHILYSFVMMTWIVKDTLKSFSCYTSSNAIWDWSNSNEGLFRNTVYPHLITLGNTVDNINGGNLAPHFLMDPWFNCKHWKLQQNHHCLFNDALHQIWNTSCGSVGKLDMKKQ